MIFYPPPLFSLLSCNYLNAREQAIVLKQTIHDYYTTPLYNGLLDKGIVDALKNWDNKGRELCRNRTNCHIRSE